MRFAPSITARYEAKDATTRSAFSSAGRFRLPNSGEWDVEKAVTEGMERVTWVYKAVHTIAANQARLPIVMREDDRYEGPIREDHPLLPLFNRRANPFEKVIGWRYRLSCLLLLSRQGVFVEVLRSRMGEPLGLFILPPGITKPIPDPDTFVSGYEVRVQGQPKRVIDPDDVLWFRSPHPIDPYRSMTPLDACGLAVESNWWAHVYNRNFMLNDGRPGGVLVIKGDIDDADAEEIKARFRGPPGITGAGRITVLGSEDGAEFVDTAITPRDAQWLESSKATKEEIMIAFGVPSTVMGDASSRTFDNADAEREGFWRETMPFHLDMVSQPMDDLDGDENLYVSFNLDQVEVLRRDQKARHEYHLRELQSHAITVDEYRELTGRDPYGDGAAQLVRPINLVPVDEAPRKVLTVASRVLPKEISGKTRRSWPTTPYKAVTKADEAVEDTSVDFGQWKVSGRRLEARRRERLAKMTSWERTAKASLSRLFARQKRVTIEKLKGSKSRQAFFTERDGEHYAVKDIDTGAIFDRETWNEQLSEDGRAWIEATVEDAGGDVVDTLNGSTKDAEVSFDLEDPEVQRLIEDQVNRLVGVNDTTYDAIKAELAAGNAAGESITKLAKRIEGVFSNATKVRAEMIARTEVLSAMNGGAFLAAKGAGIDGLEKVWLSTSDKRTRDDHRDANGQQKAMDEAFSVGGSAMMHPGDPAGPADQTIRCRCALVMATPDSLLL